MPRTNNDSQSLGFKMLLLTSRGRATEPCLPHTVNVTGNTGWFRLNAKNCVPGNSSRRFFELDHEILHTYSGRHYLKLEEGFFF